jgi:hypothetical protein
MHSRVNVLSSITPMKTAALLMGVSRSNAG